MNLVPLPTKLDDYLELAWLYLSCGHATSIPYLAIRTRIHASYPRPGHVCIDCCMATSDATFKHVVLILRSLP